MRGRAGAACARVLLAGVIVLTLVASVSGPTIGASIALPPATDAHRHDAPLPPCRIDDLPTRFSAFDDWARTLLDWTFALPKPYVPPDLVSTANAGLRDGPRVRQLVVADLAALVRAAARAGSPVEVNSAYRSFSKQQGSFQAFVAQAGWTTAIKYGSRPGHSEHQLGTTIDFRSAGDPRAPWAYRDWATTPPGKWMQQNAWKFGFVMSYPRGKSTRVCLGYEPWHYRYVGREAAAVIRERGITLRRYLWELDGSDR